MNNRRERHVVVAQVDRQSERKKRNSVPHSVESMKKIIKTSCYIAGILDMLSLMALDSKAYWIPIAGVLLSTGWLVLVAHATFNKKEEKCYENTTGDPR